MLLRTGKGGAEMIYVVGLGPGGPEQITPRALAALEKCDLIVGYKAYIELVRPIFEGRKELVASPMKRERDRCAAATREYTVWRGSCLRWRGTGQRSK